MVLCPQWDHPELPCPSPELDGRGGIVCAAGWAEGHGLPGSGDACGVGIFGPCGTSSLLLSDLNVVVISILS